jgi:hypothetical protein
MTAGSPNKTFEPGAVGTLLRGKKIPSNFPEADIPRCPICHGNAAPCSNVSEAQEAAAAKLRTVFALRNLTGPISAVRHTISCRVAASSKRPHIPVTRVFHLLAIV